MMHKSAESSVPFLVIVFIAVAELFALCLVLGIRGELDGRVRLLSARLANQNSFDFEDKYQLQTDFDSCIWSNERETCSALKGATVVKFWCDAEGCRFGEAKP